MHTGAAKTVAGDGSGRQAADEVPVRGGVQEHVEHEWRPQQSYLRWHWCPGWRPVEGSLVFLWVLLSLFFNFIIMGVGTPNAGMALKRLMIGIRTCITMIVIV